MPDTKGYNSLSLKYYGSFPACLHKFPKYMSIKDSWLSLLWKEDLSHRGPLTDLSNPTDRRDRLLEGGRTLWNQAYGGNGQENFVLGALHPCIPSKAWRSPSRDFGLESSGKGSWASLSVACYFKGEYTWLHWPIHLLWAGGGSVKVTNTRLIPASRMNLCLPRTFPEQLFWLLGMHQIKLYEFSTLIEATFCLKEKEKVCLVCKR